LISFHFFYSVLHDGSPNIGAAWVQDAFTQSELVIASLRLATEFLQAGGFFFFPFSSFLFLFLFSQIIILFYH